jgi:hypothetical protein
MRVLPGANGEDRGSIDAVDSSGFTVAFASGLQQAPDTTNPAFRSSARNHPQSDRMFIDGLNADSAGEIHQRCRI